MRNVLVTGGKGQLGTCIKMVAKGIKNLNFIYTDEDKLDITDITLVTDFFLKNKIDFCVNCAAYTAVDIAETNKDLAEKINVLGARNLAQVCKVNTAILIHISTDFVFDGMKSSLYTEKDIPNPLGVYGLTKLNGEMAIIETLNEHFIIRTSWLYSEHGNNFFKTMLRLGTEKSELSIVCDQIGTPTYAGDLAEVILHLIKQNIQEYGTYHYSNEGVASWYDFAVAIFDESNNDISISPIKTDCYPTPAKRPCFSVMDKCKIKNAMGLEIPYWRDSLKKCLSKTQVV